MTLGNDPTTTDATAGDNATTRPRRRRAATRAAGPAQPEPETSTDEAAAVASAQSPTAQSPTAEPAVESAAAPAKRAPRKRASRAKKTAAAQAPEAADTPEATTAPEVAPPAADDPAQEGPTQQEPAETAPPKAPRRRSRARATAAPPPADEVEDPTPPDVAVETPVDEALVDETAVDETAVDETAVDETPAIAYTVVESQALETPTGAQTESSSAAAVSALDLLFQAPDLEAAPPRRRRRAASRPAGPPTADPADQVDVAAADVDATDPATGIDTTGIDTTGTDSTDGADPTSDSTPGGDGADGDDKPRRRRRGGRGRRRRGGEDSEGTDAEGTAGTESAEADTGTDVPDADGGPAASEAPRRPRRSGAKTAEVRDTDEVADSGAGESEDGPDGDDSDEGSGTRRRRRRRRRGGGGDAEGGASEDPPGTTTRVRQPRAKAESRERDPRDEVTGVKGSTRLEAKRQRRRDGRDSGRRPKVISEAEFLARREAVERTMLVRERDGRTQIVVLEDGVLVEHYVARKAAASMIGNVYLGKVQNVLPSMEAAFVDIGRGRNAVLYAGEVNWDAAGMQGQPRRIELALKSGDPVLVQVSKDPVGHKGARLTSQISLPGRYLVYVPNSSMTGISRKLPDTERTRLKKILKAVVPEDGGVIVRTASEGASEAELERDVNRLVAQWEDVEKRAKSASAPAVLHSEPDLTLKVVRDVFNEDFATLVVSDDATSEQGEGVWPVVKEYLDAVAPDLAPRLSRWDGDRDVFAAHRVDEQIAKALERKVWLPSGGSLVIDRTEAMTVVDVNTGKFVGSGGNLEETVTRNNLEAAEEVVRQLRLRDVGGIVVIDFIDMVLEVNRDLVLRRLMECLGRDRTKHQVAEVTSLGLVQMTRKRVGQGLLEAFSEPCEHCQGRGVMLSDEPVERHDHAGNGRPDQGRNDQPRADQPKPDRRGAAEASKVAEAARKAKDRAEAARHEADTAAPATVATGSTTEATDATTAQATAALADLAEAVASSAGTANDPAPVTADPATAAAVAEPVDVEPVDVEPVDVEPVDVEPVVEPAPVTKPKRARRRATSPATAPASSSDGSSSDRPSSDDASAGSRGGAPV